MENFDRNIASLERRCRLVIAEAMTDQAPEWLSRVDIGEEEIRAALWANGSPNFKPELQGKARRAAGILTYIGKVRFAVATGDADSIAIDAVDLGYLMAKS